jgi:hypothetical protein
MAKIPTAAGRVTRDFGVEPPKREPLDLFSRFHLSITLRFVASA